MPLLPFIVNNVNIYIKRYSRRIVYELPHYEGIHKMKVVKQGDTWYAVATLKGEVSSALREDQHTVVDVGDVESPVAVDTSASNNTASRST